ncbi:MAG: hypothetical protein Q4C83_02830, partial [Candidatus Saccharibacteria bacterium]|nr:hypothetical protein [Candidatus Saccharibacteria bacterium]
LIANLSVNPIDHSDHNKLMALVNDLTRKLVNVKLAANDVQWAVEEIICDSCGDEECVDGVRCYFYQEDNIRFDTWYDRCFDICDIGSLGEALTKVTTRDIERLLMGFKYDPEAEEVNASAAVGLICPLPNGVDDVSAVAKLCRDSFQVPTKNID